MLSVHLYIVADQATLLHLLQTPMQSHENLQQSDNPHEFVTNLQLDFLESCGGGLLNQSFASTLMPSHLPAHLPAHL